MQPLNYLQYNNYGTNVGSNKTISLKFCSSVQKCYHSKFKLYKKLNYIKIIFRDSSFCGMRRQNSMFTTLFSRQSLSGRYWIQYFPSVRDEKRSCRRQQICSPYQHKSGVRFQSPHPQHCTSQSSGTSKPSGTCQSSDTSYQELGFSLVQFQLVGGILISHHKSSKPRSSLIKENRKLCCAASAR